MEKPYIGTYWGSREESREACTVRCVKMLSRIAFQPDYQHWYKMTRSPKHAKTFPIAISEPEISVALESQFTEPQHIVDPELGFSLYLTNGANLDFTLACGMYFDETVRMFNSAVVHLHQCQGVSSVELALMRRLLEISIEVWEPDWGVATSWEFQERAGGAKFGEPLGWLTYRKNDERRIEEWPDSAVAE